MPSQPDGHEELAEVQARLRALAVTVTGDSAVAVGYSLLVRHSAADGTFSVFRCSANRWELARAGLG